ncbi:MAG: PIN/TRAM domain-containing protein [Acidobacteriota bacterium]
MGVWLIRGLFTVTFTVTTFFLKPFNLTPSWSFAVGLLLAVAVILFEMNLRHSSLKTLIGAALGSILGIMGAVLISLVVGKMSFLSPNTATFLQVLILGVMTYVGLVVGISKGDLLDLSFDGLFKELGGRKPAKILDTSVIIDGRVADIVETGFLDGVLMVPEFVLQELQLIADSADSIKRNRGRRGLDILQKIQKKPNIKVAIVEEDYPEIKAVDLKLIELAKETSAKIVTNDFNLNKVAQLRGVKVLNINELANALKPVVLPGEGMRVFILKEGKEYNQGVAYLDDGTMVVVDNARRMIGRNVDILVTSVLQTTAGKMIFGSGRGGAARPRGEYQQEKVSRL